MSLELLSGLSQAAPATCASALQLDAPAAWARAVERELAGGELSRSSVAPCRGVRVRLRPQAGKLLVVLELSGQHVSRVVSSAADAASWIESWLAPELDAAREGPEVPKPAVPAPAIAWPSASLAAGASAPEPRGALVSGRVGLLGRISLDSDVAHWVGAEVFGDIELGGPWWVGAGLGISWDPVFGQSGVGPRVQRRTSHAIVRAGGAWPLSLRTELAFGAGLGLISALVTGPALDGSGIASDSEGVGVLELCPLVRVLVSPAFELGIGLDLERTVDLETPDGREPDEPSNGVAPEWRGGIILAAAFRVGRD